MPLKQACASAAPPFWLCRGCLALQSLMPGAERVRLEVEAAKQAEDDALRRQSLAEKRRTAQSALTSADR